MSVQPTIQHKEQWIENQYDKFKEALEYADQKEAEGVLDYMRLHEQHTMASEWLEELIAEPWYCDMCRGEKEDNEGNPCLCKLEDKVDHEPLQVK